MMRGVLALATITIAQKSPVAVQGTKMILNYSRDRNNSRLAAPVIQVSTPVDEGRQAVATWNQSQLMTEDIVKSGLAALTKSPLPPFSKL
ncbi:hypothetical protein OSTOST_21001 [Ostertagia ostertagi]